MSGDLLARAWTAPARTASIRDDMVLGAPVAIVAGALGWRLAGAAIGIALAILLLAAAAGIALWRARRFDRRWLIAALDAARGDVEDSSDLLFADPAALGPLQRIQRARIDARLAAEPVPQLRPPRAPRLSAALGLAAIVLAAVIIAWPAADRPDAPLAAADEGLPPAPGIPRLVAQRLVVTPPAYTGLPPRSLPGLDARVPAGSTLGWTLRFDPMPRAAQLVTLGGAALPLVRDGAHWTTRRRLDRSLLYRVVPVGGRGTPRLHRLDAIADRPPAVRILAPATTLTAMAPGQRFWPLSFEATDDYGVAPIARLRLVVAQGAGENVRFSERTIAIRGTGPATRRVFAARVDLATLGFAEPGDLVAQLTVADMRTPVAQSVAGPSLILRRAAPEAEGGGLEMMTRRVMPAYFRSQRQIIIDAEALLVARPRAPDFAARSDTIGADQALLRLRYGQFMGEETGGGATAAMPTSDAEEGAAAPQADHAAEHGEGDGHDDHPAPGFGAEGAIVAAVGHTHDEAEATTLLDPGTRATLRRALDAMWQSETALRQGDPRRALPHANRALVFIKQIQQATRIFLARTGAQLPPIDPSRRLTGDRSDLAPPTLPRVAPIPLDATPATVWRILGERSDPAALAALDRWARPNAARIPDPLALAAAIDAVRRDGGCAACRERLRGVLWGALPRPAPGVVRRGGEDAAGRRYLQALR